MIPLRIKLAGFLSYKDEQDIRFDGASLWMLSGANGSGKSSIFDAVTYALFGHHRGGSSQAAELVNKDSTTLDVEFDFAIDDDCFRIRRTLKKLATGNKGTFQILRSTSGTAHGDWEPVPTTGSKKGFDDWVKDHIGLNFETFTSSVLLLQGKAEKLLDSTPSGRAGVLASIVDLERYQKLHAKADEHRKERKAVQETLQLQLDTIREVTDDELALASLKIEEVETARIDAQKRLDTLHALEIQAGRWAELQGRLAAARDRLASDESLLGHAVAIEKQYGRFRELRDVLPTVGTIVTERGRAIESERKTEKLAKNLQEQEEHRRQHDHNLGTLRKTLADLKTTLASDEAKSPALNTRLRRLVGVIEQVRLVEDQQAELRQFEEELSRQPADAGDRVRELQTKHEHLTLLAQAMPSLIRIADERAELAQSLAREKQAKAEAAKLLDGGTKSKAEHEAAQAAMAAARAEREQADGAAAETRALQQQAAALADEFQQLTGQKNCRACGQPLTPKHLKEEKQTREAALKEAEATLNEAIVRAEEYKKAEAGAVKTEADARLRREQLRERYRERTTELKQAAVDIRRLSDSIRDAYLATPEPFRSRISKDVPADWTTVAFPARDELAVLHREAAQADAARRALQDAQAAMAAWQAVQGKMESARQRLAKLQQGLPDGDPVSLRQEFTTGQAEEAALANAVKAAKKSIQATETDVDNLQRNLGISERELIFLDGEIRNEENSRAQSRDTIARLVAGLPESWQRAVETAGLSEQLRWKEEFADLEAKSIEARYAQLSQARGGLDRIRAEILGLEAEANGFPDAARRAPEDVRQEIAATRPVLDDCDKALLDAKQARALLDSDRNRRTELGEQVKAAEGEHARYRLLAELLGRDRLQRFLVRKAERQIVDYANAMLDRLSDGQLFLRLVDADTGTDKALDLECSNRVTGGSAINVAFLSGSQRFRVAVSLALGIGQYASTQHRPIECVIIDEGFGCLDRAGRQVMIQELQNLRGHLRCILLVSHQEEFADAFHDGYRFELHEGATRVVRRMK